MDTSNFAVQDLRAYDADPRLGQRLATLRSQLHMDVNALAAASDVPADMIVAYESGAALPDPAAADDLAEALDVSVEQLMAGWSTPEEAEEPMVGPIAGRIRVLRASRALSREDLAQLCNVTLDQVDDWESGRWIPSREQVARICRVFGITRDRLMMNNALQLSQQLQQTLPRRERKPRPERPDFDEVSGEDTASEAEESPAFEEEPTAEARPSRPVRRNRKEAAAPKETPARQEEPAQGRESEGSPDSDQALESRESSSASAAEKPAPSQPAKRTRRPYAKQTAKAHKEATSDGSQANQEAAARGANATDSKAVKASSSAEAAKNTKAEASAPSSEASEGAQQTQALGDRIKLLRKQRKMTQKALAEAAGTSTGSISKWEAGAQPRAYMLPRLAKALGVSVAELKGQE